MPLDSFFTNVFGPEITLGSSVFKLFLSLLAGGAIGLNREQQQQAAGFRTHILICMGATLLMILSIYIPQVYFDFKNGDPGRIAAQVVSGIGFLGAGAIIRFGKNIRGLTTAASIWLISAVGLTIGAGLYLVSFATIIFTLFTLIVLGWLEPRLMLKSIMKNISLVFASDTFPEKELMQILKENKIILRESSIAVTKEDSTVEFSALILLPKYAQTSELLKALNSLDNIRSIKIV